MTNLTLSDLGWSAHFSACAGETENQPARIASVARDRLEALAPDGPISLLLSGGQSTGAYAVGDWVLYEPDQSQVVQLLERKSAIRRRASGHVAREQLIAANVDTLGIVTSCNADFNVARLERYLALAAASDCLPLIVLTKADEATDPDSYRRQAERLSPLATALALNARDPAEVDRLSPWCGPGQTLALLGSSGVGKTTLSNGLTGRGDATAAIRDDDAKGRHTTTARHLHRTRAGGWLIDTPGMRELQLTGAAEGIESVFDDISELATACRFADCAHESEPGCAVRGAIAEGRLEPERVERWRKLLLEDARNSETAAERRARGRSTEKLYTAGRKRGRAKRGD